MVSRGEPEDSVFIITYTSIANLITGTLKAKNAIEVKMDIDETPKEKMYIQVTCLQILLVHVPSIADGKNFVSASRTYLDNSSMLIPT